ncbi:MAG: hypothetical protein JSU63_18280 [Phycisphaerales bacterium]|nr:MAG: hypothetical protein JSU63_18280 [Phycisphaerales bacterium]
MSTSEKQRDPEGAQSHEFTQLFQNLGEALQKVRESERYRLLGSFISELADRSRTASGLDGSTGQIEALSKQVQALGQDKAVLEDNLRTTQADLDHAQKSVAAEESRASQHQSVIEEQRTRLKDAHAEIEQLQAELVSKNAQLHEATVLAEDLQLKAQRADLAVGDDSRTEQLEEARRELTSQLEQIKGQLEQLRADKDAEIERLKEELAQAQSSASGGADALLADLWKRLASAKPPLVEGAGQPNKQCAERLVDAFIELVSFVDNFDKSVRPFLNRYCKYNASIRVPWEAFAKGEDVIEFAKGTVAAKGGKPVGPLRFRLRLLHSWTYAAMVGSDAAMESIESELRTHMLGPVGAESNPNCTLREYLRNGGDEKFLQHIRELRSKRLAETYGRG